METKEKRDDFSLTVKEIIKKRAAYICSNPTCRKMTIAPSIEDENKVQYIGICAHITAAIKGGPRFDNSLSSEKRADINNGIFLCSNCASQIDKNNGIDFSVTQLKEWKQSHEKWILENLNKTQNDKTISIVSNNQFGGITANVVNVNGLSFEKPTDKNDSINEHDKNIFLTAESILDEDILKYILDTLLADESIKYNNLEKIETLKFFYSKTSNQYINENIESAKKLFFIALEDLDMFLGTDFDMWPYNQKSENYKICMNPMVNIDRAGEHSPENDKEHSRLKRLLYEKAESLKSTYENLRRAIKITLYI